MNINTIWTIFSVFNVSTEKMVNFEAVVFVFCHDDDMTLAQIIVVGCTVAPYRHATVLVITVR